MATVLRPYRGRFAPSPTGYLHPGHARTFWTAQDRARAQDGRMVLRVEDLDRERCKPEYAAALPVDMQWCGLTWDEGPDVGGSHAPYVQRERTAWYEAALGRLAGAGAVYPCRCTRRDAASALGAPHAGDVPAARNDPCRPPLPDRWTGRLPGDVNWRFRSPENERIAFVDGCAGLQAFVAGRDFGDFIVWRRDGSPAYQLAVVVDDAAMEITEVVRGADLLPSTAQQLLVYRALDLDPPAFYHCPLATNPDGTRLAKRAGAHSLRALRAAGADPRSLRVAFP